MENGKNQKMSERGELAGAFVEIALTNEQVSEAIAEEIRLGIRDGGCAFLDGKVALPAPLASIVPGDN